MDLNRHWIRWHILRELTREGSGRYSQLRPDGVEGNLFMYHLDGLIGEGLVEKTDKSYRLTDKGRAEVSTMSLESGRTRLQPAVLTAVVARDDQGRWLTFRWNREPNRGRVSLVHGMAHVGVSLPEMAAHELAEKAGLEATLRYLGVVEIRVAGGRHWLTHIFAGTDCKQLAAPELRPELGESWWASGQELAEVDFVPGFRQILDLLAADDLKPYNDIVL